MRIFFLNSFLLAFAIMFPFLFLASVNFLQAVSVRFLLNTRRRRLAVLVASRHSGVQKELENSQGLAQGVDTLMLVLIACVRPATNPSISLLLLRGSSTDLSAKVSNS